VDVVDQHRDDADDRGGRRPQQRHRQDERDEGARDALALLAQREQVAPDRQREQDGEELRGPPVRGLGVDRGDGERGSEQQELAG
jgi:hypothetical protein